MRTQSLFDSRSNGHGRVDAAKGKPEDEFSVKRVAVSESESPLMKQASNQARTDRECKAR